MLRFKKQPQHLLHYEIEGGIREMLNIVLEKGPATVRAAAANNLSSSTSDDGGDPDIVSAPRPSHAQLQQQKQPQTPDGNVSAPPPPEKSTTPDTTTGADSDTDDAAAETTIVDNTSVGGTGGAGGGAKGTPGAHSTSTSRGMSADEGASTKGEETGAAVENTTAASTSSQDGAAPPPTPPKAGAAGKGGSPNVSKPAARGQTMTSGVDVGTIDQAFRFSEHAPQPPGVFMAQLGGSGIPLPPTTTNIQYAACGGGLVINERYHGLPLHTNEINSLRPHLTIFAKAYDIQLVSHVFLLNVSCLEYPSDSFICWWNGAFLSHQPEFPSAL